AIGASATGEQDALRGAGYTSLIGLGLGTVLQIVGLMQEDQAAVDDKIHRLDRMYQDMLERVRPLAAAEPADDARVGEAIERFITDALAINVKGGCVRRQRRRRSCAAARG